MLDISALTWAATIGLILALLAVDLILAAARRLSFPPDRGGLIYAARLAA